jgi:uncharacterized protein (DUF1330 family)
MIMPAYILAHIRVTDPERFAQYRAAVPAVIAQYGGRYLVRGGEAAALEGAHDGRRLVVVEFPSDEAARRFWDSPDYARMKKLREGAAEFEAMLVPGA